MPFTYCFTGEKDIGETMGHLILSLPNWVRLLKTSHQENDLALSFLPVLPSTTTTLYPLPRGERSIPLTSM